MEPNTWGEPMAKKKNKRHGKRVRINIESNRHRFVDADGVSAKACIDGLVNAGLLQGDRAQDIAGIYYSQSKVSTKEPESTIITITEVLDASLRNV